MSRKDYEAIVKPLGIGLGIAQLYGGEDARTLFYNETYCPIVDYLASDNERFDRVKFSYRAAEAEANFLARYADDEEEN